MNTTARRRSSAFACLASLCAVPLAAQGPLTRSVRDGILTSKVDPPASFVVDTTLHYVGGQTIDILKVAGAEQYFFIQAAPDSSVRHFAWLQFEHYYPTNTHTYNYSGIPQQPISLGLLTFLGDIRTSPNYFTMDDRPGSDSKAAEIFLRQKGYKLDGTFVTLRMFYTPDAAKRKEVMIIYGEALPRDVASGSLNGTIVPHAQGALRVQSN